MDLASIIDVEYRAKELRKEISKCQDDLKVLNAKKFICQERIAFAIKSLKAMGIES